MTTRSPITKYKLTDARGFMIACCGTTLPLSIIAAALLLWQGKIAGEIGLQIFLGVFGLIALVGNVLGVMKRNDGDE